MTGRGTPAADSLRRRFLALTVLRWLPTGVLIPVIVLFMVDRGLTLTEIGAATVAQAIGVALLELPTGGLADAVGRRRVLLAATVLEVVALVVFVLADGFALFALAWGLFGVYRALESGPLESWFVDAAQAADGDADIERAMAHRGVALGLSIALGSTASGGLVAMARAGLVDVDPLALPLLVAIAARVVDLGALWWLMDEPDRPGASWRDGFAFGAVRRVVGDAVSLVRRDRVLLPLVSVELTWGVGMVAFEVLTPVQLAALGGSLDVGATAYGPTSAVGWLVSAGAAAMVPRVTRRLGPWAAAVWMRVAQGLTVLAIGLAAGVVTAVVAFVLTMGVHGGANAVHSGLLHRSVEGPMHRATIVSVNSLLASVGGGIGGVALGAIADVDLVLAFVVGAVVLACGAPLYLTAKGAAGPPAPGAAASVSGE